jgi:hypothetical protein
MASRKASGYSLTKADVPIIMGMVARDDRDHDIAAWFGVNQGRIAEAKEGKFGTAAAAPAHDLPPKGPPGIKGRRLREDAGKALDFLTAKGDAGAREALALLKAALSEYDRNEA